VSWFSLSSAKTLSPPFLSFRVSSRSGYIDGPFLNLQFSLCYQRERAPSVFLVSFFCDLTPGHQWIFFPVCFPLPSLLVFLPGRFLRSSVYFFACLPLSVFFWPLLFFFSVFRLLFFSASPLLVSYSSRGRHKLSMCRTRLLRDTCCVFQQCVFSSWHTM